MDRIDVAADVRREVALLAAAWQVSEGEAVQRLVEEFRNATVDQRASATLDEPQVHIHALYKGVRVEGIFYPRTRKVKVTTGRRSGTTFRSPSGAAAAVIGDINPGIAPNRAGWTFWTVTETGDLLQAIRQ